MSSDKELTLSTGVFFQRSTEFLCRCLATSKSEYPHRSQAYITLHEMAFTLARE